MGFCRLRISKIEIRKLDGRNLMFNNLIESSSHRKEFKRRGSFLRFITATYAVLFVLVGVISIYAYDAHLEDQNTEVELISFVPPNIPDDKAPEIRRAPERQSTTRQSTSAVSPQRTALIDSADNPNNPPLEVGVIASAVPPSRPGNWVGSQ